MTDEAKKDHPEDIESILSDLDAILTDMGGEAAPAPAAPPPAEVKLPPKVEAPKAAMPPPSTPSPPPSPVSPPPAPVPAPSSIELAPREGMIKLPEKKPERPKPAAKLPETHPPIDLTPTPAQPPEPPAPVVPSAPAPAPALAAELPEGTPKGQIRRVAYVHTSSCSDVKTEFSTFLSSAARTISKKPLYLREVMSHEVGASSDPNAVLEKAKKAKAGAILAIVEGWPSAKVDELSEACSRASMLFRVVAPAGALKKSTVVDILVDMMLLPGEN